jgi:hypothetical protein
MYITLDAAVPAYLDRAFDGPASAHDRPSGLYEIGDEK